MAGFQIEEETTTAEVVDHPSRPKGEGLAISMLMAGVTALSKKFFIAASAFFTALSLVSAWWLWMTVLPSPSVNQLIGLGGYAAFILVLEWVRRR